MTTRRSVSIQHRTVLALATAAAALACRDFVGPVQEVDLQRAGALSATGLAAPSDASANALSESEILLAWIDHATNEAGFEVHRSQAGAPFGLLTTTAANVQTHLDQGVASATQYCYRVRAFRAKGGSVTYSAFSNTTCATTPAPPPPPPPPPPAPPAAATDATAMPATSISVTVGWTDNSSDEDGFRIEHSTDGGATWAAGVSLGENSTSVTLDAVSEQLVCYRVVAFNAGGSAAPSNMACATPGPAAPGGLGATFPDPVTVDLTWTDNSTMEDGYTVWVANCVVICNQDGSTFSYVLAELPANTTQYRTALASVHGLWVWVVATRSGIESEPSNYVLMP